MNSVPAKCPPDLRFPQIIRQPSDTLTNEGWPLYSKNYIIGKLNCGLTQVLSGDGGYCFYLHPDSLRIEHCPRVYRIAAPGNIFKFFQESTEA